MSSWNQKGATTTEYLILLILVACMIIAVVKIYGETIESKYRWADVRVVKSVTF